MKKLALMCSPKGGCCPSIYENENGDYIIQGISLDDEIKKNLKLGKNEDAILVPADLIDELIKTKK